MRKRNHSKRVLVGAAALTMLFAGSAFTASNTIDAHAAGTGTVEISGVDVTNIAYELTDTRDQIAQVVFDHENENVSDAKAQLQLETGGIWYQGDECTVTSHDPDPETGTQGTIVCDTPGQDFEAAKNLTLIVGDNLTVGTTTNS